MLAPHGYSEDEMLGLVKGCNCDVGRLQAAVLNILETKQRAEEQPNEPGAPEQAAACSSLTPAFSAGSGEPCATAVSWDGFFVQAEPKPGVPQVGAAGARGGKSSDEAPTGHTEIPRLVAKHPDCVLVLCQQDEVLDADVEKHDVSESCHNDPQNQLPALTEKLRDAEEQASAATARADAAETSLRKVKADMEALRAVAAEQVRVAEAQARAAEEKAVAEHAARTEAEAAERRAREILDMTRSEAAANLGTVCEQLQRADAQAAAEVLHKLIHIYIYNYNYIYVKAYMYMYVCIDISVQV